MPTLNIFQYIYFLECLDPCNSKPCASNEQCISKSDQSYECVCALCEKKSTNFVCNNEALTFPSQCHVDKRACETGEDLYVIGNDPCSKCI